MRIISVRIAVLILAIFACAAIAADLGTGGQLAQTQPTMPGSRLHSARITIACLTGTVRSAGDLYVISSSDSQVDPHADFAWEIHAADNSHRVARIAIPEPVFGGGDSPFSPQTLARLGSVADGDYVLACTIAGRRCSNVVPFRIDSKVDPKTGPALELSQVEASGIHELPQLVLRAHRRFKDDPAWNHSDVYSPTLMIDGKAHIEKTTIRIGPDGPMGVGNTDKAILDLSRYSDSSSDPGDKPLQFGRTYKVIASVGAHHRQSNAITLSYQHPLADAWDKATATIKDAALPAPSIFGSIVGPDGKPAQHYEVYAEQGKDRRQVFTDSAGNYEFRSLPRGNYTVFANPFQSGNPQFTESNVWIIDATSSRQLKISFQPLWRISGRVTRKDGSPVAHWTVSSTWNSPDNTQEYDISATTDAAGRYTVAAPFGMASFIGWGGDQVKHDVPPGSKNVDFVADNAK